MVTYFITVFAMIVLTSVLLLFVFGRIKILNHRMIMAIALSSVLAGLFFPGMFSMLSAGKGLRSDVSGLLLVSISTLVLYIMLTFILGIVVSVVIPDYTFEAVAAGIKNSRMRRGLNRTGNMGSNEADNEQTGFEENYLEQIYSSIAVENTDKDANTGDITSNAENNLEKSVDSDENIDKMGIEAFEQENILLESVDGCTEINIAAKEIENLEDDLPDTAENLSLNDCVDMAFKLKEQSDNEGAILYYMYALDKKPEKDLVFWIVLDICVLYKALGQVEFAHDILSNYVVSYSDVMDISIKDEIEKNLLYVRD